MTQSFPSTDEHPSFLIWDGEGAPPKGKWIPVLWRSYREGGEPMLSIPVLVEENSDTLRSRFLAYIYEIGITQIKGKRLVDHLELRPGFSYWWMTLIAGKSNAYESLQIVNVLKMFVLEDLVRNHLSSAIILVSGDKTLAQAFRLWCKNAGLLFEWWPLQGPTEPESLIKRAYRSLPQPMQAVISLANYIWQHWPLKQQNASDIAEITFVDYLIHLDKKSSSTGQFASNFWTDLVGVLDRSGSKVNWLHRYIQGKAAVSAEQVRDLIARFNQRGTGRNFHAFLDGALCFSLVLAALIDYSRLVWMSLRLNKIKHQFCPTESRLDLWPLFRQDWRTSMLGKDAISNCIELNLFERTFRRLPHQKLGVYLQENQGWEMALIYAWRAAGHGQLIGVPHSTVRFWDLRYFYDPRSYQRTGRNDLPLPDKVALNGPAATAAYRQGGYPVDQFAEVEALRYMHLADTATMQTTGKEPLQDSLRVLIFGDYLSAVTRRQMQWLVEAASLLPPETRYTVMPHPACPVLPKDYPSLQLRVVSAPLTKILADCDVAFTSNITSAAVDAYCAGVSVVSALEGKYLNMSPLRGLEGVVYVTGPKELADALGNNRNCEVKVSKPYFCLCKELPRWRQLVLDNGQCKRVDLMEHG